MRNSFKGLWYDEIKCQLFIFGLKKTKFQPNENMVFYGISIALFDYYNATQDGLGFPTFKLMYGRTMRGAMRRPNAYVFILIASFVSAPN